MTARLKIKRGQWYFCGRVVGKLGTQILLSVMFRPRVPVKDLIEQCWPNPDHQPLDARNTLAVTVRNLNRRFIRNETNWRIVTRHYGWGYSLERVS